MRRFVSAASSRAVASRSPLFRATVATGTILILLCEWWVSEGKLVASPGQLVRKVSELLGISEATIVHHDRNLVVAGLRSKSGRGPSAARMTARDAAHLLVAVLGSHHVKDSAQSVRGYRETRLTKYLSDSQIPESSSLMASAIRRARSRR